MGEIRCGGAVGNVKIATVKRDARIVVAHDGYIPSPGINQPDGRFSSEKARATDGSSFIRS